MRENRGSTFSDRRPWRLRVPPPGPSRIPDLHLTLRPETRTARAFPLDFLRLATDLLAAGETVQLLDESGERTPAGSDAGARTVIYGALLQAGPTWVALEEERKNCADPALAGPLARLAPPDFGSGNVKRLFPRTELPDRSLLRSRQDELLPLELSRGCSADCNYCPTPRLHPGPVWKKPAALLERELQELARLKLPGLIQVRDDDLLADGELAGHFFELCRDLALSFIGKARIDSLTRFGVEKLPSGLRSLNLVVRGKAEDPLPGEDARAIFARLARQRVPVELSLLVGFPADDAGTLESLLEFLRDLPVAKYCLIPVVPLPGIETPLGETDPTPEELLEATLARTKFTRTDWQAFLTDAAQILKTTAMKAIKQAMLG